MHGTNGESLGLGLVLGCFPSLLEDGVASLISEMGSYGEAGKAYKEWSIHEEELAGVALLHGGLPLDGWMLGISGEEISVAPRLKEAVEDASSRGTKSPSLNMPHDSRHEGSSVSGQQLSKPVKRFLHRHDGRWTNAGAAGRASQTSDEECVVRIRA